ncbi:thiol reductant ABC exporter subunit CydD [Micromonospora sp. WMMD987]|uniref:thiol reductant ABC exporter subunit CydD n=1 Tax=Micromonospora sp. WMMD987 TaxID=3016089 RepID=UPI00249AD238|nr:thiol reductant ABC exporter subunit CydD [Micromonospora sp. WMMD987]WFE96292.1 thiol reductant ABC exporter subunit CydD [Micromonospora sp. WMMD987]
MNRRPFDPRLLRRVPGARRDLAVLAALGGLTALLVVAQATALATVLATGIHGRLDTVALAGFVVAVGARSLVTWGQGTVAARAAATVKATLRADLLAAVGRHGPGWVAGQRAGQLATLTGRGLDALDAYFTGYLPQLVLSVTVPAAVLARLVFADWSSALIVVLTLPLIPVFGALLGWQAQAATERQWRRLSMLGGHFLDMIAGLPTLRAFGRATAQTEVVRRMADGHRAATMKTLRIAFLSALVLELVATLSVALVAVPVGIRLLDGGITLATALLVLLLTPEAYLPLRTAGSRFHASMEGLTALDEALTVSAVPAGPAAPGTTATGAADAGATTIGATATGTAATRATDAAAAGAAAAGPVATASAGSSPAGGTARTASGAGEIRFHDVTVAYPRTTALRDVTLTVRPGERIAIVGPSGAGKSTLLGLLLGFVTPTAGRITVDGVDLADVDPDDWRRQIAWVPQRAHLFAATLADNIRLGAPDTPDTALAHAVADAALDEVVGTLPDGLDTLLGERGHGLSSGQRQRVALARALLRDAPLVLLDEPTARLDTASETVVLDATRRLVAGRTALLVAHRPALLADADRVLHVAAGRVTELTPTPAGEARR